MTSSDSGDCGALLQDERQRSGPERIDQLPRQNGELRVLAGLADVGDMNDERIEARATLGREDRRHRFAVGRVGAEAVHRLGGERDEASRPQVRCGGRDRFIRCLDDAHVAAVPDLPAHS